MAATGGADPLEDSRRLEGGHETLAAAQAQTGCDGKFRDGHGRVYRDFIEYQLFRSRRSLEWYDCLGSLNGGSASSPLSFEER